MLARFRVLLPYDIFIEHALALKPIQVSVRDDIFVVHPPMQATIHRGDELATSPVAIWTVLNQLEPQIPPFLAATVLVNGQNAFAANMLQIHLQREAFDRTPLIPTGKAAAEDALVQTFFDVANVILQTLRTITDAPIVKPIGITTTFWRVDFLNDDETDLASDGVNIRRRMLSAMRWQVCGITSAAWDVVKSRAGRRVPAAWEMLLLDAEAALPEVGPALVLAAAAIEAVVSVALDELASSSSIPPQLWQWVTDRGDYGKDPSVDEQYDFLLHVLTGVSLKDDEQLWQAYRNLKQARNSFAHEGVAVLGKQRVPVTVDYARQLVARAREIASFVEALLPATAKRPAPSHSVVVEIFKPFSEPSAG